MHNLQTNRRKGGSSVSRGRRFRQEYLATLIGEEVLLLISKSRIEEEAWHSKTFLSVGRSRIHLYRYGRKYMSTNTCQAK